MTTYDSKFPVGVNLSVTGYLSQCALWLTADLSRVYPANVSCDQLLMNKVNEWIVTLYIYIKNIQDEDDFSLTTFAPKNPTCH